MVHGGDHRPGLQSGLHPLVEGLQLAEVDRVAAAAGLRQDAEAGDTAGVAHRRLGLEQRFNLPHHRDRALQRGGFGEFDVDQEVTLVFIG